MASGLRCPLVSIEVLQNYKNYLTEGYIAERSFRNGFLRFSYGIPISSQNPYMYIMMCYDVSLIESKGKKKIGEN